MKDINSITVAPALRSNLRIIRSKHEIFSKGKLICDIKDDCMYFRLPHFDEDNFICVNSIHNGWYRCFIECDVPCGVYPFEDDSTEDEKIVYFGTN